MAAVSPYLSFTDQTEEAFNFYKSVFGGEFGGIMRFSDVPAEHQHSPEDANKIMHVSLPIGNGTVLMGSDTPAGMGSIQPGNNFSIAISPDNADEANRIFDGLSAGGNVTMPLTDTFWGALFGMLTDRFGVNWMVNYQHTQQN